MNDFFVLLGIQSWKPVLTALALPPVPWMLLILVGARLMFWRRSLSWLVMLVGATGLWLSCTTGAGYWLERLALKPRSEFNRQLLERTQVLGTDEDTRAA